MDSRDFGSIIPILEEDYVGYTPETTSASDQEEMPTGIYMAGEAGTSGTAGEFEGSIPINNSLIIPVSSANAAVRATEIEAARAELLQEVQRMEEERDRLARENQRIQKERQRIAANAAQGAAQVAEVNSQARARATNPTVEFPPTPGAAGPLTAGFATQGPPVNEEVRLPSSQRPR